MDPHIVQIYQKDFHRLAFCVFSIVNNQDIAPLEIAVRNSLGMHAAY